MIDLVMDLNEKRKHLSNLSVIKDHFLAEWQDKNKILLAELEIAKVLVNEAESELRNKAVAIFQETGNKKPAPGVEVKLFTEISYPPEKAFAWALRHSVALTLDRKVFEKIAVPSGLDFVAIHQVPRAQIATDLEKAIAEVS